MTYETEYQLEEFDLISDQSFDDNGKAYTSSPISNSLGERMLKLIKQLRKEICLLEKENVVQKKIDKFKDLAIISFMSDLRIEGFEINIFPLETLTKGYSLDFRINEEKIMMTVSGYNDPKT